MNKSTFNKCIRNIPVNKAVFTVIKVPVWARDYLKIGDLISYDSGCFVTSTNLRLELSPSCVKFDSYRPPIDRIIFSFNHYTA